MFPHIAVVRSALVTLACVVAASCGPRAQVPTTHVNPIEVAEAYASKHYPREVPRGSERAWLVEDHGDIWTVEMFAQGAVGGGIKMAIHKSDGKVMGSERTQ
jgi:hypothetical protein